MVTGIKDPENEKEVIVGAVNNGGEDKEVEEKKEHGESGRGPVGRHLRTKAEAYEYLADLSNYPSLANWLAGEALEEEARRLRRTRNKKRKRRKSQVVGDVEGSNVLGTDEALAPENRVAQVAEGAQRSNHLRTDAVLESEDAGDQQQNVAEGAQGSAYLGRDAVLEPESAVAHQHYVDDTGKRDNGNTSSFGEGTEPTGHDNVLEASASVIDLCYSYAEEVKVTVDATTEEANNKAETDDFIDIIEKGEQAENDADLERTVSLEARPADRKDIIPVKLLGEQAEKDADLERTVSLEVHPPDRKDIIPVKLLGEHGGKDADLQRTVSLEAQTDRKDIIPVKLLGEQAEKNADLERTVSLEAQPADRKDIIPVKLIRAPRYFEPQESSQQTCSSSSEDDYIAAGCSVRKKKKKKQKICCICGRLGHYRTKCKKVNKCLFCSKKGHLAKDCPQEDIVREQTSKFCLRCANSGHDMFSCPNDYSADDLEKIQCYVCKAFGHLCCVNYGNEGPKSVSCYNCGESDHLGSECKKLNEKSSRLKCPNRRKRRKKLKEESRGLKSALVHPNGGEKGAQECNKSEKAKEVSGPIIATTPNVPTLAKLPEAKKYVPRFEPSHKFGNGPQNDVPRFNPPRGFGNGPKNYVPRFNPHRRFGYGPQNYVPRFCPPHGFGYGPQNYVPRPAPPHRFGNGPPIRFSHNEIINGKQSWPQGRGSNYPQQQRPFFGTHRSHVWRPPVSAAEGNKISSSNSSSQSSVQPQQ